MEVNGIFPFFQMEDFKSIMGIEVTGLKGLKERPKRR